MSEESDNEKTEEPTPHRREKAREEGQIPRSKELSSLLMLLMGWSLMMAGGERLVRILMQMLHGGLTFSKLQIQEPLTMLHQLHTLLNLMVSALLPFLLGLFLTGVVSPLLIGGLHFGKKILKLDLKRLNPLSGLKRMVSAQVASELLKSILKVLLVGSACGLYLFNTKTHFIQLVNAPVHEALASTMKMILHGLLLVILFLLPVAGYDIFYQIFSNLKKLRMTRQEIRDEFKQQEGDPHIKNRIKQLQRAAARSRMMSDVPDADVIVNNPTHYSVALSYKELGMSAPIVLAKGAGETALRIRELAEEHRIPMLEAPPLARALYRHGEMGKPIPTELYSAVAEVLAWVYGLRRWRHSGGTRPPAPRNLPVPEKLDFEQEIKNHD
ncbi:MAG: flagellar type III secretion system protein FlhB [Enterobacteriaceae bacterium]|jgi:flagellar biosynthetic protein FlhB|nr:flagellar type III secretion system protein FlhB [Enterobacteriaceae bacterium]